jgi:dTDP-4-amino-4,6-dideoxygalactose transaminase
MREIPYALQQITSDDVNAVMAALQAPMLTQGPLCERFETRFADAVGARFAMAISSGTAALHGAYAAAGVQAGRDGRTTRIKFAATANAAHYLGARVEFVDIDPASALVDTEAVNLVDPSGIHALVPVHFAGHVADMEALARVAAEREWVLVEGAAHALGASCSTRNGRSYRVGACAHSTVCCFSFNPVKHITTGEGGMVTTNGSQLALMLRPFLYPLRHTTSHRPAP